MHNGGWRILTWQISDFMQKKISDVRRRILNTSPGIVVFRATWCSTKTAFRRWRGSRSASQRSVPAAAKGSVHHIHGAGRKLALTGCTPTDASPAAEDVEITLWKHSGQGGHDNREMEDGRFQSGDASRQLTLASLAQETSMMTS